MKRHKPKPEPRSCHGCRWYTEFEGVCCNGDSEQRGDVSTRCELYIAGEPLPGVRDEDTFKEVQNDV